MRVKVLLCFTLCLFNSNYENYDNTNNLHSKLNMVKADTKLLKLLSFNDYKFGSNVKGRNGGAESGSSSFEKTANAFKLLVQNYLFPESNQFSAKATKLPIGTVTPSSSTNPPTTTTTPSPITTTTKPPTITTTTTESPTTTTTTETPTTTTTTTEAPTTTTTETPTTTTTTTEVPTTATTTETPSTTTTTTKAPTTTTTETPTTTTTTTTTEAPTTATTTETPSTTTTTTEAPTTTTTETPTTTIITTEAPATTTTSETPTTTTTTEMPTTTTTTEISTTTLTSTTSTQSTTTTENPTTTTKRTSVITTGETESTFRTTGKEDCQMTEVINGVTIKWEPIQQSNYYLATPHCLDTTKEFIIRKCEKGEFINPKQCKSTQLTINCPEGYIDLEEQTRCIKIIEERTFEESKCQFPYEDIEYLLENSNDTYWFPARRFKKFGPYQFTSFFQNYNFNFYQNLVNSNPEDFCVVINQTGLHSANCEESNRRLCVYNYRKFNQFGYCKLLGDSCTLANYKGKNCFCIEDTQKNPAVLEYNFQTFEVSRIKENCKLSLEFDPDLKWVLYGGVKIPVENPFWSDRLDAPRQSDPYIVATKTGWQYQIKDDESCFINDEVLSRIIPKIEVVKRETKYFVQVINPESLICFNDGVVYCGVCYTNSNPDSLISITNTFEVKDEEIKIVNEGQYWCEGYTITFDLIKSKKILIENFFNTYIIEILVRYEDFKGDPTSPKVAYNTVISKLEKMFNELKSALIPVQMKWMDTIFVDEEEKLVRYVVHLNLKNLARFDDYNYIKGNLEIVLKSASIVVSYSELLSRDYCLESFTSENGHNLTWNATKVNHSTRSNQVCLNTEGEEVFRECVYDPVEDYVSGPRWLPPPPCHVYSNKTSHITNELSEMWHSNETTPEMIENLVDITKEYEEFEPVDIYLTSSILEKVDPNEANLSCIVAILSNVMLSDSYILRESQIQLKATDNLLINFDEILNVQKKNYHDSIIPTEEMIVFIFDAELNYTGLALLEDKTTIKLNESIQIDDFINLDVAAIIPKNLTKGLSAQNGNNTIVITIYLLDSLFNDVENKSRSVSKNFGILLEGIKIFSEEFTLIYKGNENSVPNYCGFWNFNAKSSWFLETSSNSLKENFWVCKFSHTTHFGLLVLNGIDVENNFLDVITAIECVFSIIGIFGIFLTGILFKTWRKNTGNKILLHYSVVSLLQICFLYISGIAMDWKIDGLCIFIGIILHYTVLSQFCWMFVFAVLQYHRHVLVFRKPQKWVLAKAYLVSYILPIFPIILLLCIYSDSYVEGNGGLCYPTGDGLLFTIILPLGILITINLTIFVRIIMELYCMSKEKNSHDDEIQLLRFKLVFLLFFLLGITWAFGFMAQVLNNMFFLYLFSMTASIQGFIIFMFFIVLNENARMMYVYIWNKYAFFHCYQ